MRDKSKVFSVRLPGNLVKKLNEAVKFMNFWRREHREFLRQKGEEAGPTSAGQLLAEIVRCSLLEYKWIYLRAFDKYEQQEDETGRAVLRLDLELSMLKIYLRGALSAFSENRNHPEYDRFVTGHQQRIGGVLGALKSKISELEKELHQWPIPPSTRGTSTALNGEQSGTK